jgi:hypothetical protein
VYRILGEISCLHFGEHEKLGDRRPRAAPYREGGASAGTSRCAPTGHCDKIACEILYPGRVIHVTLSGQALLYRTLHHDLSLTFHRMVTRVREEGV